MIVLKQLNAEAELLKYESDVRNRKSGNPCLIEDLEKIFRENSLGGLQMSIVSFDRRVTIDTLRSISTRSLQISHPKHVTQPGLPNFSTSLIVAEEIEILVFEFKSLMEPIDSVKRLIYHASLLEFEGGRGKEIDKSQLDS
ncbi:hypothetical protein L2E82_10779 [Cichorium intybus]|uniref:Uncharacterized protein n=1 Tax=Cichorium intybus TaxID=13427 RepID=A0ACB9GBD0_CICIN|nr:hypothetical protein L2E82_10779 [Cichorium intybus]